MKYAIVILSGAADDPIDELDGKTPLETARMPSLAALAMRGRVGAAVTTPPGIDPGVDACTMSLLGYDPVVSYPGRAVLDGLIEGLPLPARGSLLRLSLACAGDAGEPDEGVLTDPAPADLTDAEASELFRAVLAAWTEEGLAPAGRLRVHHLGGPRAILIDEAGADLAEVPSTAPWFVVGRPWRESLPRGRAAAAKLAVRFGEVAGEVLEGHPINTARREQALRPLNVCWLWGGGKARAIPTFRERHSMRGVVLSSTALPAAVGQLLGLESVVVAGAGPELAVAAAQHLRGLDVVCVHVASAHEAGLAGDPHAKVAALELADRQLIGPLAAALADEGGDPEQHPGLPGWRMLVAVDHATPCAMRRPDGGSVPFVMSGAWVRSLVARQFTETDADQTDLFVDPGHQLMEYFLRGGLAAVRGAAGSSRSQRRV